MSKRDYDIDPASWSIGLVIGLMIGIALGISATVVSIKDCGPVEHGKQQKVEVIVRER